MTMPRRPRSTDEQETVIEDLAFGNTHTLRLAAVGAGPAIEIEVASRPYEVLGVADQSRWVVELPAADLHPMSVVAQEADRL